MTLKPKLTQANPPTISRSRQKRGLPYCSPRSFYACSWSVWTEPSSQRYVRAAPLIRWCIQTSVVIALQIHVLTAFNQAIPQITNDFNSLADVGWYGSAYLLTCCAFQLLFGKIYTCFSLKGVYLGSLLLFEVASAICGAAPNSVAFCIGRALAGVGAAGIFAGTASLSMHPPLSILATDGWP